VYNETVNKKDVLFILTTLFTLVLLVIIVNMDNLSFVGVVKAQSMNKELCVKSGGEWSSVRVNGEPKDQWVYKCRCGTDQGGEWINPGESRICP
jgi:hypothetical protein